MPSMLMLIVGLNIKNVPTGTGIEERATILVVEAIVKRQKRAQRRRGIGERVDVAETDQRRGVSRRGEG